MTRKQAKEFSVAHWKAKVKNSGKNLRIDELDKLGIYYLKHHCGYCAKYFNTESKTLYYCAKCPIRPKVKDYDDLDSLGCRQKCHPYDKWNENKTSKTAQAVLTLIEKS